MTYNAAVAYLSRSRVDLHGDLVDRELGSDGHGEPYQSTSVSAGDDRHDTRPGSGSSLRRKVERQFDGEP